MKSGLMSIITLDFCTVVVEVVEEPKLLPILTDFVTDCVVVEVCCIALSISPDTEDIEGIEVPEDIEGIEDPVGIIGPVGIKDPVGNSDDAIESYE